MDKITKQIARAIGAEVRRFREEAGMTIPEAVLNAGHRAPNAPSIWRDIETGTRIPSVYRLDKMVGRELRDEMIEEVAGMCTVSPTAVKAVIAAQAGAR